MTVVYGNWLLHIKGFEPGETGKERYFCKRERFPFLSGKARQPLECGHNIPLNSSRLNDLKVEKD